MIQVLTSTIKSRASRAYTNNPPLALESIRHMHNTHLSSITIMLLLGNKLCEGVINIVECCNIHIFISPFLIIS